MIELLNLIAGTEGVLIPKLTKLNLSMYYEPLNSK